MKTRLFILGIIITLLAFVSCKQTVETLPHTPASPQTEAQFDRSHPEKIIDVNQAIENSQPLKLSQIASSIEYHLVGDGAYTVKQVISLPKDSAFITFNYPRIYYRKQNNPSKRYGFKALDYKWNKEMNGLICFTIKRRLVCLSLLVGKRK